MPEPRQSRLDKRELAREQARLAREKRERQERRRRILIPASVTVAVLAIATVVVLVVATSRPAPQTSAGPKNMISDGILFTGVGGVETATTTAAIPAKGTPSPHPTGGSVPQIVEYLDFGCPYCNQFESTNGATINSLVAAGKVTLEVRPVSILDRSFLGTRYPSRAANAAACVANSSPDDVPALITQFYADQPAEQTSGLTNARIISLVHRAGITDAAVDACIRGESYRSWVTAATARFLADPGNATASGSVGTPTIKVDGQLYTGSLTDASQFDDFLAAATNR